MINVIKYTDCYLWITLSDLFSCKSNGITNYYGIFMLFYIYSDLYMYSVCVVSYFNS